MSLAFRAEVADRDVRASFEMAPGETVALLGPNGAGKSTVLAVAAGLLTPDSGEVVLDGRTLVSTDRRIDLPPHRREVALLAQDPLLFPHLSVRENVAFGPRSRGRSRKQSREQADRWLDRVGVVELAARRPADLSGGQAQRAAVARALAAEPQLLLLDEPMAGMGAEESQRLIAFLRALKQKRAMLLIEHDMDAVFQLADRITVLVYGRAIASGTPDEIRANADVRQAYLGEEMA